MNIGEPKFNVHVCILIWKPFFYDILNNLERRDSVCIKQNNISA